MEWKSKIKIVQVKSILQIRLHLIIKLFLVSPSKWRLISALCVALTQFIVYNEDAVCLGKQGLGIQASKRSHLHIQACPAYIFPSAANIKIHTTLYLPWLTSVYENHWLPPPFSLKSLSGFPAEPYMDYVTTIKVRPSNKDLKYKLLFC